MGVSVEIEVDEAGDRFGRAGRGGGVERSGPHRRAGVEGAARRATTGECQERGAVPARGRARNVPGFLRSAGQEW